jgi:uncharacterized protein involved in exopolysaccharide biosynthesis
MTRGINELDTQAAQDNPAVDFDGSKESNFLERLIVLAERKKFILGFTVIAGALAATVAFLLPLTYEGTTKIMPPQQSQSVATAMLAQLNPLGSLGAMAGNQLGLRNPSDLYVDMLRSRTVADDLIQRFSLMQVYHVKKMKDARLRLESSTSITVAPKDGVITVTVEDHDPQRATDLGNAYVEELEKLTQVLAVTEAGRRRLFFEREAKNTAEDLANAEMALKQTQEKTGMIQLDSQSRAMIEAMITLRAQVATKEVLIQTLKSYEANDNPELKLAEEELAALRTQLARFEHGQGGDSMLDLPVGNVPSAGLEYIRKLRAVKYRESLLEVLTKQYEIARIDEGKEAAVIQVLDKAVRPTEKSGPRRGLIVLLAVFSAFWIAVIFVLFKESVKQDKEDPEQAARLQRLKYSLLWRK